MQQIKKIKEIFSVILLANCCIILVLLTRSFVGERASLYPQTIQLLSKVDSKIVDALDLYEYFSYNWTQRQSGKVNLWQSNDNPDLMLVQAQGAGMWGTIFVAFCYNMLESRILVFRVIEQNETLGLGSQIAEESFYEQFDALKVNEKIKMVSTPAQESQFDAISGATMSSKAVETIINISLGQIKRLTE